MPAASSHRLVALALPPGPAFVEALETAWQRGDAVLPVDPRLPQPVADALRAAMRLDEPVEEGVGLVIATSGSTGEPKGAVLTHEALAASARATMQRIGTDPADRWLSCLPWHHIGGLQVLLRARLCGQPLVVHDRFDVARVAAEADVTLVSLVPTQLARLLEAGVDLRRFRVILLGGAAAPPALLHRAAAAGAPVVTTYGMSETSGGCVYDGRPLDGVDIRMDGDGRIHLRGPVLMSGYRGRPDLTAEVLRDGWLRTADLGSWDGTRLDVHGRVDDVIVSGGENVVAARVEAALAEHPAVREVTVVGTPDPEWGERVVAYVVAADDALTLPEARSWVAERLGPAAAPGALICLAEIPRLASGKPDRLRLRRRAAAAASPPRHPR
ncbi:MAG TPA: AMP-binding protein [Mycobacteriales bacterium]|nr:AMP-binding protein [Mycobacteriales bacterium]